MRAGRTKISGKGKKIMEKAKTELGGALSGFLVDSDHCLICLEWI